MARLGECPAEQGPDPGWAVVGSAGPAPSRAVQTQGGLWLARLGQCPAEQSIPRVGCGWLGWASAQPSSPGQAAGWLGGQLASGWPAGRPSGRTAGWARGQKAGRPGPGWASSHGQTADWLGQARLCLAQYDNPSLNANHTHGLPHPSPPPGSFLKWLDPQPSMATINAKKNKHESFNTLRNTFLEGGPQTAQHKAGTSKRICFRIPIVDSYLRVAFIVSRVLEIGWPT